jgi:hypothetical protein
MIMIMIIIIIRTTIKIIKIITSSGQSRAGVFLHQVFPEIYTRGSRGLVFCIHQRDLRTHQVIL